MEALTSRAKEKAKDRASGKTARSMLEAGLKALGGAKESLPVLTATALTGCGSMT